MLIRFDTLQEVTIPRLNGGEGAVSARMFAEPANKIMLSRLAPGTSIGLHTHTTSSEVNYVVSGTGEAACDGQTEPLAPGVCHYCPKGSAHSIRCTGGEDLVLFTVVPEQ